VFWSDNYVSMLPGDKLTLHCKLPAAVAEKADQLVVSGWNVKEQRIEIK